MRENKKKFLEKNFYVTVVIRNRCHLKRQSLEMGENILFNTEIDKTLCGALRSVGLLTVRKEPYEFLDCVREMQKETRKEKERI